MSEDHTKASYRAVANMIMIIQGKHTSSLQLESYTVVKKKKEIAVS